MRVALCVAEVALLGLAGVAFGQERTQERLPLPGGREMRFELITPEGFDAEKTYPVAIVFPGGPQTLNTAMAAANALEPDARTRGWIVAAPATVGDQLFFNGANQHVPALMAHLRGRFKVERNRFHLLGISNGGLSAFRIAIDHPLDVLSVTAMPGYLPEREDAKNLDKLKGIPVRLFVGSDDRVEWVDAARVTEAAARGAGLDVKLDVRGAQPHVIRNLSAKELLDMLDGFRAARAADVSAIPEHAEVAAVLDQLHLLASKADEAAYFALFDPQGVFIGTDASERWTIEQFRAYAKPIFAKGKGWTYTPKERHIDFAPDRSLAWFDELLDNAKYGVCRGTGVVRKVDGRWLIAQYHLTVPVPNELMERVAGMIRMEERKKKK